MTSQPITQSRSAEEATVRVGRWIVRGSEGFIERAGERRLLRLKSMEVLLLLAGRPGSTIPREEFLKTIWGEEFVEEANLTRCITEVRAALGDDAKRPRYVATVPRRGYRLVAPVRSVRPDRGRHPRVLRWATALLLASALMTALLFGLSGSGDPSAEVRSVSAHVSSHHPIRVAILPITNLGEDPAYAWVPDAAERMLAAELAADPESLAVPAETVLRHASDLAIPPSEIDSPASLRHLTSAVGASHWVSGSFLPVDRGDSTDLRFDLLLLDAATGTALHGVVLTTPAEDLAEEVSSVAGELRTALEIPRRPPANDPLDRRDDLARAN